MVNFSNIFGLLRTLVVGGMLLFLNNFAHADIWGYVDERGTAHFAAEKLDARYALFLRGDGAFDSRTDIPAIGLNAPASTPFFVPSAAQSGSAARLLSLFSVSPTYQKLGTHLQEASSAHGVDYALLQALIATESGFDPAAISPKGAVGLMQLMPDTARRYGVAGDAKTPVEKKLTDPRTNIKAGTRYLRYLLDLFPGRLELALAAYNAGEGAVQRAGNKIPNYKETQNYVKTVMQLYAVLQPSAPAMPATGTQKPPSRVRMELPGSPAAVPPGGAVGRGNMPSTLLTASPVADARTEPY